MPIQTAIDSISQNQGSPFGFKNRIINGGMAIDQRNAGASVTANDNVWAVDRWQYSFSQSSKGTSQQNAGSVTPPPGFTKYLGFTSSSSYSVTSSDNFILRHLIEGTNIADLNWGLSTAKPVTFSFWVRSSLTGTFSGFLTNSAINRVYIFTYTISSANTWEYKTITINGDTTGTWLTDTGRGIMIGFTLGSGSTYTTSSPNQWGSSTVFNATGSVSVVGTNAATFYVTGCQLEVGRQASSFDFRSYGTELILCQRYFEKTYEQTVAIGTATENGWEWIGSDCPNLTTTGTLQSQRPRFSVTKRSQPSMSVWDASGNSGKATRYYVGSGPSNNHTCTTDLITVNSFRVFVAGTTTTTNAAFHWAANAEL